MNWGLAAALAAAGVPVGVALDRIADGIAQRRPDARRRTPLPGRRTAVLVATPLLFAGCGLHVGWHPRVVLAAAFTAVLVVLAAIDVEQRIVPNRIVVPAALVALAAETAIDPSLEWLLAALAGAGFFLVAALARPGGIGMGDVKLALLLGAMLGRGVAAAIAIALASSLVPAVAILARHGRSGRTMGIPFAPFLAIGGVVALFAGRRLVDAYLGVG